MTGRAVNVEQMPAPPRAWFRDNDQLCCVRRHLSFGWWLLLAFLTLGVSLEAMHGFKVGWYLDVANQTRRLMWTLAHAHGTVLALVHLAFAATVYMLPTWDKRLRDHASACLMASTVLLPLGFFLGGIFIQNGDPGLGILLVPLASLLLFIAVLLSARAANFLRRHQDALSPPDPKRQKIKSKKL